MSTLVCGSLAYDTILTFPDQFKNYILADQMHVRVCWQRLPVRVCVYAAPAKNQATCKYALIVDWRPSRFLMLMRESIAG